MISREREREDRVVTLTTSIEGFGDFIKLLHSLIHDPLGKCLWI